jgi:cell division septal protein FtsQ
VRHQADSREPSGRAARRNPSWLPPPVRAAALTGLAVWTLAAAAISPLFRVRTVVWTGSLPPPALRHRAFEAASLDRPLLLLPERRLCASLQLDPAAVRIDLVRHLPRTLEVRLVPRSAAVVTDAGVVLDAGGRVLETVPAFPGLPVLAGFEVRGDRLEADGRRLLRALGPRLDAAGLAPARIEKSGGTLLLVLRIGTRVRLDADRVDACLLKLRLYEGSLAAGPMPAEIDLRFQDQIVVRAGRPPADSRGVPRAAS